MTARRPPFPRLVVTWRDAYSVDEWTDLKAAEPIEDHVVETSGYLVKEDDRYLMLAPTISHEPSDGSWTIACVMAIPKGCIISQKTKGRRARGARKDR
jgi:hypothetical protein